MINDHCVSLTLFIVIRSSTDKLQDAYAKAKKTSPVIRLSCDIAETVVDTSLKFVLTVARPFVKPLTGPGKSSRKNFL